MDESIVFLEDFIERLAEKNIAMPSLRYKPYTKEVAFSGDYDFITSPKSIDSILQTLFELASSYCINFVIDRIKYGKIMIYIYNKYDDNSIILEIWTYLDVKCPKSLGYILWEDIEKEIVSDTKKGYALSLEFEALYYIAHLQSKKKDLRVALIQMRLHHYLDALKAKKSDLVKFYEILLKDATSLDEIAAKVNGILIEKGLLYTNANREKAAKVLEIRLKRAQARIYAQLLRKIKVIPVVGPDGVGKTSIIEGIKKNAHSKINYYRFKGLFRHSLLYKLSSLYLRKKLPQSMPKNQYDDIYGAWLIRIASLRYPLVVLSAWLSGRFYFSDRFFHDYIIQDTRFLEKEAKLRKNWKELLKFIPNSFWFIHLDAPTEVILSRKEELNAIAIEHYREYIFQMYLQKPSLVYSYINTSLDLQRCVMPLLHQAKSIGIK